MSFLTDLIKPVVSTWLKDRALKVPAAKEQEIATKVHISVEQLRQVETLLAEYAVTQIDKLK